MNRLTGILCGAALLAAACAPGFAQDEEAKAKIADRLAAAGDVMNEIMATPDKGIPRGILSGAYCVVVVPHYKKGAFVVGAQYGKGVATCRTPNGWSAPVMVRLTGGSFGWQIGGQSTDLVLIAMNKNGLQDMLKNHVKLGADAAASAGPVGRNAQAGTDWKLNAEFLTYSRSKGLFAGLDLEGTDLSKDGDDTRVEYGSDLDTQEALEGHVPVPENARPFVRTVAKYFVSTR